MQDSIIRFFELLGIDAIPLLKNDPYKWKYPMEYSNDFKIPHDNGITYWQHFKGYSYGQDVYEIDVNKNTIFPYKIKHKNVYFFYHLGGKDIIVRNADGEIIDTIQEATYFPSYYCNGDYQVEFKKGKTIISSVVFRSGWPRDNFNTLQFLTPLVEAAIYKTDENIILKPFQLGNVLDDLEKIYKLKGLLGKVRGISKSIYTEIANKYNEQAHIEAINSANPIHLLKEDIDKNFLKPKLGLKKFASDNSIPLRRLCSHFTKAYGRPPYNYFLGLKMELAQKIIRLKTGRSFTSISKEIGYPPNNFSTRYKTTFGHLPSEQLKKDEEEKEAKKTNQP